MPKHISTSSKNDINDLLGVHPNVDLVDQDDLFLYGITYVYNSSPGVGILVYDTDEIPPEEFRENGDISEVFFGEKLSSIGTFAFSECINLKGDLVFPSSLETIGQYAFADCINVKTIIIPESVQDIQDGAFAGCTSVKSIYSDAPSENWTGAYGVDLANCGNANSNLYVTSDKISGYGAIGSTGFRGFPGTLKVWETYPFRMPQ